MANKKQKIAQLECIHFKKTTLSSHGNYSYNLIASQLNLCIKCEKKLRNSIIEQKKIEDNLPIR